MNIWKKYALPAALLILLTAALPVAAEETAAAPPAAEAMEAASAEEASEAAPEEITPEDAALTITAPKGRKTLAVGTTLQFTAVFSDPERINAEAGNDRVLWQVLKKDGTRISASQVKISSRGLLKTAKQVKKALNVVVTATSEAFGTQAEYELLIYPPVARITLKPGAPVLMLGQEPLTVKASTSPAGLQKTLTWRVKDASIAKVKKNADGTATLTPLKSGTTYLTAKAESGASAKVKLTVMKPVSKIMISGESVVRKNGFIDLKAKISPSSAPHADVAWALDVDGSLATINSRGRLSVSNKCPVGTVITVSCWIKGSDRSVMGTKEVTVTYARQKLQK